MKRGIYYVMLCLVGLTALSCNKQLDISPIDQIPDQNFWSTEKELDAAVAGGYAILRKTLAESPKNSNDANGYHNRFYMYGDRRGLLFRSYAKDQIRDLTDGALKTNKLRTEWGTTRQWDDILFNWAPFFQVIEQCNTVIENAGRVPDNEFFGERSRQSYVAEARFLRAFTYFYIVRVWGNVPLVTKSKTADKLGRTDYNAVLDFVETELTAVESLLPVNYNVAGKKSIRATQGTVQATLAHVYAWRQKYVEAIASATKVINGGVYRLLTGAQRGEPLASRFMMEYQQIWKGKTDEGIFEIDFDAATGEIGVNGSLANLTMFGPKAANRNEPLWALNFLKIGDSTNAKGTRTSQLATPKQFFPDTTSDLRYVAQFDTLNSPTNPALTMFTKYQWVVDASRNLFDANIVIFRMADIILLRAEANAALKNYIPARQDLNTIRTRVWTKPFTGADDQLPMEIFKERTRELLGEGHYFYDLVRTRLLIDPDYVKVPLRPDVLPADFNDGAWTWPVSNRAFVDNPNMAQMRYWQRY